MIELKYWAVTIIDGIANGLIYGLFGLGLVMIFRANKIFNFSPTQVVAFLILLMVSLSNKWPFPILVCAGIIAAFALNVFLHFSILRPITGRKHPGGHSTEGMITFGILTVFDSLSTFFFGDTPSPFPSLFGEGSSEVLGISLSHNTLGVSSAALLVMFLVMMFYRFSRMGLLMEAVSENIDAARLRGIHASNVLALAWGLMGIVGILGGILLAPTVFVFPHMLTPVFGYSMVAVVIGGAESPAGALLGGVIIGILENVAANTEVLGSDLKYAVVFGVLVTSLLLRPRGLFGRADFRRV